MTWRVVGANFDQMHMHGNLGWVVDHPDAELVGLCDEDPSTSTGSLETSAAAYDVPTDRCYDDLERCLEETEPDLVIGCPMNAQHASFVERVAAFDVHVAVEKPFAATLADADRMIAAMDDAAGRLAINWPTTWSPVAHEVKRLVDAGTVGDVFEVQYYGGNAGAPPAGSWFYDPDCGGGSMLDYLGYGATFSTWFRGGDLPGTVSTATHVPDDLDVDVQSVSVCRYEDGLSALQTSWRLLTHPWERAPIPRTGYEIVGTAGSISTREPDAPIRVQTADGDDRVVEPDPLDPPRENLVQYLLHCLETGAPFEGPTDPAFCRDAQRILETARVSAERGEALGLVE